MMPSKRPPVRRRMFLRVTLSTDLRNDDDENGNADGHESGYAT